MTVRVFLLYVGCSGCGTLEMVGGGLASFHFLYLVVSFSGGQLSVVGFLCYILRFPSVNLWFFRAVLCFESY